MKRFIVLLISVLSFTSCSTKQPVIFNECIIEFMSEEDTTSSPFSYFSGYFFYCQGEDNKILLTDANEFKYMYDDNNYFDMDYKTFLKKALNQQIVISNIHGDAFSLDKEVTQEYQTKIFTDFLLLYFKNDRENHYTLKNNIGENKRNTIFYYLFINNYLTSFDDVIGIYNAFPSSEITKDLCKKD